MTRPAKQDADRRRGRHRDDHQDARAVASPVRPPSPAMFHALGNEVSDGSPSPTRARMSVELIASAGIAIWPTFAFRGAVDSNRVRSQPGRRRDEVREREHLARLLPVQDLEHRVRAGDEVQLGVWVFGGEGAQRLDRVREALAVDLDP